MVWVFFTSSKNFSWNSSAGSMLKIGCETVGYEGLCAESRVYSLQFCNILYSGAFLEKLYNSFEKCNIPSAASGIQ